MSKDTGGSAFPSERFKEEGMTLRDYFAAKAMQALIISVMRPEHVGAAVSAAYVMADAMLAERNK